MTEKFKQIDLPGIMEGKREVFRTPVGLMDEAHHAAESRVSNGNHDGYIGVLFELSGRPSHHSPAEPLSMRVLRINGVGVAPACNAFRDLKTLGLATTRKDGAVLTPAGRRSPLVLGRVNS